MQKIQRDVIEELKWTPYLNSTEIGVSVKNSLATLSGTVDTYSKKTAAEKAAQSILGVKAVAEDIQVIIPGSEKKTDTELADMVLTALKWNNSVNVDKVKIKVEDGWVAMEGQAEWQFQKNSAYHAVKNLSGVVGVTNLIHVRPHLSAVDIKGKISSALVRNASVDANHIDVETHGSKVI